MKCIYPNCNEDAYKRKNNSYSKYCYQHNHTRSEFTFIQKYGEEEGKNKWKQHIIKKSSSMTLNGFINRHGEEEGIKKFKERGQKISKSNSLEGYIERYGEEKGKSQYYNYIKKLKKANSLEGYIERYGEEKGKKRWYQYIKKQKDFYNDNEKLKEKSKKNKFINSINYYIEKYGEEDGKKKYNEWKKTQDHGSLTFFINKYGEEDGKKKYINTNKKKTNITYGYSSIIANKFFKELCIRANINGIYSGIGEELKFKTDKLTYFYDFNYGNKIIEFNGDIWHANPLKYNYDDYPNFRKRNLSAKEIWEYDKNKILFAKKRGYNVKIVWESEYKDNPEKILNECIKFLNSKK